MEELDYVASRSNMTINQYLTERFESAESQFPRTLQRTLLRCHHFF